MKSTQPSKIEPQYDDNFEYIYENEDAIDESLKCVSICLRPLVSPILHVSCESIFCESHRSKLPENRCPGCNNTLDVTSKPFKAFCNMLDALKVKCPFCHLFIARGSLTGHIRYKCPIECPNGCLEKIFRAEEEEHCKVCPKQRIECPNVGCEEIFERMKKTEHESECKHHLLQCPNECGIQPIKRIEVNSHLESCPRSIIPCPQQCGMSFERHLTENHRITCQQEPIPCEASNVLCPFITSRQNMPTHIESCSFVKLRPVLSHLLQEIQTLKTDMQRVLCCPVDGSRIVTGTVTTDKIADNSISTSKVIQGAVTTDKIADNSISTPKLIQGAVTTDKIADNSISTSKLIQGAVTTDKIADNSISTPKLIQGAVTTNKVADNSISTPKLIQGTVTTDKIADNSISTPKLIQGAVTTDKIADNSISTPKLIQGAVSTDKIAYWELNYCSSKIQISGSIVSHKSTGWATVAGGMADPAMFRVRLIKDRNAMIGLAPKQMLNVDRHNFDSTGYQIYTNNGTIYGKNIRIEGTGAIDDGKVVEVRYFKSMKKIKFFVEGTLRSEITIDTQDVLHRCVHLYDEGSSVEFLLESSSHF